MLYIILYKFALLAYLVDAASVLRHAMNSQNDVGVCGLYSSGDEFVAEDDF